MYIVPLIVSSKVTFEISQHFPRMFAVSTLPMLSFVTLNLKVRT